MGICTMLVVLTSIVWYLKFQKASDEDKDMKPCNAIYYWKTQFQLNNYEKSFIEKHDIRKYISDSLMLTMGKIKTAYLRHFP